MRAVALKNPEIHVGTPMQTCREINARLLADSTVDGGYTEDIFEDLVSRFEEPIGMNRWDRPLFTVLYDDPSPPLEEIWNALVGQEGKMKTVKPHQATVLVGQSVLGRCIVALSSFIPLRTFAVI